MHFLLFLILLTGCSSSFEIIPNECQDISVYVSGAVKKEGKYILGCEATFADLLEEIELDDEADISNVKDTMPLYNHDEITIRYKEKLNVSINTAGIDELVKLKGIGEKTAQKIIDYRNEHGLFEKIEDIKNVKGIGEKKFEAMKEYISL